MINSYPTEVISPLWNPRTRMQHTEMKERNWCPGNTSETPYADNLISPLIWRILVS